MDIFLLAITALVAAVFAIPALIMIACKMGIAYNEHVIRKTSYSLAPRNKITINDNGSFNYQPA